MRRGRLGVYGLGINGGSGRSSVFSLWNSLLFSYMCCVAFTLNRLVLPNVISRTSTLHPDSSSYRDATYVVADCEAKKPKASNRE